MSGPDAKIAGYMIAYNDNSSDLYSYGIPEITDISRTLYTTVAEAKKALDQFATQFDSFQAVAYGQAFPYESVTFEQQLQKTGAAVYGWATLTSEEEGGEEGSAAEQLRLGIVLVTVYHQGVL